MLLALVGGAIGCGLAYLIVHGFVALSPAGIPRLLEATVNVRVLIFVLLSSSIAAVAFGTLPALEKPRPEALVAMTVAGTRRTNLRKALMAAQVWMTLILVTGALLFLRSLRNLEVQLLGMNTQNIVTAAITLGQQKYAQPAQRLAFFEALEQKLQQLPGVAAVALSDSLPPDTPARTIDPQTVAKELRDSIATLDPTLPVESSTLGQTVYRLAERPRFTAALLSLFAGVGLVLAAVGIFGLVSLLVSQRTREIAIRLALGANPATVTRVMVFQTLVWIAGGAIAGTFCSLVAARWIGALLFEIKPNDPATLTEAALLLLAVALLASYIPARRTAKVDPMVALRYE
jgi:hypothetical protein